MGLLDSIFNFGSNMISQQLSFQHNKELQQQQFQNQKKLSKYAYGLDMKSLRTSPTNARTGLERAGFNPILAVNGGFSNAPSVATGSATGGSVGMSNNPSSGIDESVTNAYKTFKLDTARNIADIDNIMANTKVSNASVSLTEEQAKTEQYRQKQMESETALNNINRLLADKDLEWYDRRQLMEIKKGYIEAQAAHLNSEANQLNAHTAQADYRLRKGITDYENVERKAIADFYKKHPKFKTYEKFGGEIGKNVRDAGVGIGSIFAGKSIKNNSVKKFDKTRTRY